MRCPIDGTVLIARKHGPYSFWECEHCSGLWIPQRDAQGFLSLADLSISLPVRAFPTRTTASTPDDARACPGYSRDRSFLNARPANRLASARPPAALRKTMTPNPRATS